ncbi:MAG: tyrosine-type recombinase/integrase, partial [Tolypothrix sp. Co-bin9]|nr:tyrosine-type recombinase/integrase [Tolypothrix sp. Co-bin9]
LYYALLLLLWGNALRRNEISTLDLRHFDASRGTLSIFGKGKQVRVTVNLPKVTVIAITDWLIARGGEMSLSRPLFTSVDFQNYGNRLTGDGIYKIVKRLFKRAGVEKHMGSRRDTCKCDSFWRNPIFGRIPGFSRVTPAGVECAL